MADAAKARQEGGLAKERETYRAASVAHPTSKEPWSKLAESYFDASDYGNAILSAQEVLQRDASNSVAQGMLAVSGLRVSAAALSALRQQQSLGADTRAQAADVVKSLREALGEAVLVPPVVQPTSSPPAAPRRSAPPPRAAPAPTATSATPSAPKEPVPPAPAAPKPPANPFDRLR